jgi:hypothetical protein
MNTNIRLRRVLTAAVVAVSSITVAAFAGDEASTTSIPELGRDWREKRLDPTPTRYIEVEEDGSQVLLAASVASASALWVPMEVMLSETMELSWRWKVTRGLSNAREREKLADDYAARVLVSFDPDPFSKDSRAICYVWASEEPVGSVYTSPYSTNVVTIVLRNNKDGIGNWSPEKRDIIEDFRREFGSSPQALHAVAVMVDTDNTGSRATAWFSDFALSPTRHPVTLFEEEPPPPGN